MSEEKNLWFLFGVYKKSVPRIYFAGASLGKPCDAPGKVDPRDRVGSVIESLKKWALKVSLYFNRKDLQRQTFGSKLYENRLRGLGDTAFSGYR